MKRLLFVLVLLLCLFITGCGKGSSGKASPTEPAKINETREVPENSISEDTPPVDSKNVKGSADITGTNGYVSDFDLYAYYTPNPLVTGKVLSDGLYLQIGNTVLEIGKSTLQDFINAGVDLYNSKASGSDYYGHPYRDQDLDKKCLQEYIELGKSGYTGYLSGDIQIVMFDMNRHLAEAKSGSPIIDTVRIENYAGNVGNPFDSLYGGSNYRDINSIYITGGIKFTGPVSNIADNFGKVTYDQKGESNGYPSWAREFTADIESSSYQYHCQVLSRGDHCSSIVLDIKDK